MTLQKLSLVLGGANSGKSALGERLVRSAGKRLVYVATAQAFDAEMEAKIARHRAQRGTDWRTVETPHDAAQALESVTGDEAVLLDCATLWLSNHLLAESDVEAEADRLIAALAACRGPVVMVSNETGLGVVPDNALARRFRAAQGHLNQRLAAEAGLVVFVAAGLPMVLKGELPEGVA